MPAKTAPQEISGKLGLPPAIGSATTMRYAASPLLRGSRTITRRLLRRPERNARTLCGCQSVAAISSTGVAPFARSSSLITVSDLLEAGVGAAVDAWLARRRAGLAIVVAASGPVVLVVMVGLHGGSALCAAAPTTRSPDDQPIGAEQQPTLSRDSRRDQRSVPNHSPVRICGGPPAAVTVILMENGLTAFERRFIVLGRSFTQPFMTDLRPKSVIMPS